MKAVVVYSGGMDSRTVLQHALDDGYEVYTLSMLYGQRHAEMEMGAVTTTLAGLELGNRHRFIDLSYMSSIADKSALIGSSKPMPTGHYADENMKATVVPNRNMILLANAVGYAINIGAPVVMYGAHSGDHTIYPDCRPEFLEAMNKVAALADWSPVEILAPFLHTDKEGILRYGLEHGVDYEHTWTCYDPSPLGKACGRCGSCQERLEAFHNVGQSDPLKYVTREIMQ